MDGYGDAECEHREQTPDREESRTACQR